MGVCQCIGLSSAGFCSTFLLFSFSAMAAGSGGISRPCASFWLVTAETTSDGGFSFVAEVLGSKVLLAFPLPFSLKIVGAFMALPSSTMGSQAQELLSFSTSFICPVLSINPCVLLKWNLPIWSLKSWICPGFHIHPSLWFFSLPHSCVFNLTNLMVKRTHGKNRRCALSFIWFQAEKMIFKVLEHARLQYHRLSNGIHRCRSFSKICYCRWKTLPPD